MQWKLVAAGSALSVLAAGGLTWEHFQAQAAEQRQRAAANERAAAELHPRTPEEVLRIAHRSLARGTPQITCYLFNPSARAQFARAHSAPTCRAAAGVLSAQVTAPDRYGEFELPDIAITSTGGRATVDGCAVTWDSPLPGAQQSPAGPPVGQLTLRQLQGAGWEITGYQPCTTNTPEPGGQPESPSPSPSTIPSAPRQTAEPGPADPDDYARLLTRAIARGDTTVCAMFTDAAAGQFAAAHGVDTCQQAITQLSAQVTNTIWYSAPTGATTSDQGNHTSLNACSLDFHSLDNEAPGPQIGHLELTPQADGYIITGYRAC